MRAYMQLKIKPIEGQADSDHARKKQGRFSFINRVLGKSVKYYTDEDLRRMGSPYLWTQ